MIVKKKKVSKFEAEQWFKGVEISFVKVIDKGPFIPSGNWSDRFEEHPDVYIRTNRNYPPDFAKVTEGDWILQDEYGDISVYSDEDFKKLFEAV